MSSSSSRSSSSSSSAEASPSAAKRKLPAAKARAKPKGEQKAKPKARGKRKSAREKAQTDADRRQREKTRRQALAKAQGESIWRALEGLGRLEALPPPIVGSSLLVEWHEETGGSQTRAYHSRGAAAHNALGLEQDVVWDGRARGLAAVVEWEEHRSSIFCGLAFRSGWRLAPWRFACQSGTAREPGHALFNTGACAPRHFFH